MFFSVIIITLVSESLTFPGSSLERGTLRKHLFNDRLCRMEFCGGKHREREKESRGEWNTYHKSVYPKSVVQSVKKQHCQQQQGRTTCWHVSFRFSHDSCHQGRLISAALDLACNCVQISLHTHYAQAQSVYKATRKQYLSSMSNKLQSGYTNISNSSGAKNRSQEESHTGTAADGRAWY